jgi:hypothetical protein
VKSRIEAAAVQDSASNAVYIFDRRKQLLLASRSVDLEQWLAGRGGVVGFSPVTSLVTPCFQNKSWRALLYLVSRFSLFGAQLCSPKLLTPDTLSPTTEHLPYHCSLLA